MNRKMKAGKGANLCLCLAITGCLIVMLLNAGLSMAGQENVTICHKGQTITVAEPAVAAHLDHGDTVGPCVSSVYPCPKVYDPESMIAADSLLYADLGPCGIWMWDNIAGSWSPLTPSNPESMVASGSLMYADFGPSGIWMWDGDGWIKLSDSDPQNMVASGSLMYADFGPGGIWMYDDTVLGPVDTRWTPLTPSNPESMEASGSLMYADFGPGGIWRWDGDGWWKLTP